MNRDLSALLPEVALVVGGVVAFARGAMDHGRRSDGRRSVAVARPSLASRVTPRAIAFATALVALAVSFTSVHDVATRATPLLTVDSMARGARALALALAALEFAPVPSRRREGDPRRPALLLFALAGLGVVLFARSAVFLCAGVEVAAISLTCAFALTASPHKRASLLASESAGTGLTLFGLGLLFVLVRTFDLPRAGAMLVELTRERGHVPQLVFVAMALFVTGVLVKLGVPPVAGARFGVNDGRESFAFAELVPAAIGVAFIARVADVLLSGRQVITTGLDGPWPLAIGTLAILMLTHGLLAARKSIRGDTFVRSLGVVHLGFAELALASMSRAGQAAAFFEIASGLTLTLVLQRILDTTAPGADDEERDGFDAIRGQGRRQPIVGTAVGLVLLTSLGVPPTFGFVARLTSMEALLEGTGPFRPWFVTLAGLSVCASVAQALVLVRFARVFYAAETMEEERTTNRASVVVLVAPLVVLAAFAAPAINFVEACVLALE